MTERRYHVASPRQVTKKLQDLVWKDIRERSAGTATRTASEILADIALATGLSYGSLNALIFGVRPRAGEEVAKAQYPNVFVMSVLSQHYGVSLDELMRFVERPAQAGGV